MAFGDVESIGCTSLLPVAVLTVTVNLRSANDYPQKTALTDVQIEDDDVERPHLMPQPRAQPDSKAIRTHKLRIDG